MRNVRNPIFGFFFFYMQSWILNWYLLIFLFKNLQYKPDMEMCAGKKWLFPEKRLFFFKMG